MRERGYNYLAGCASVSLIDGGHTAASLYRKLTETALAPVEYRVFPRCPLPLQALDQKLDTEVPALIKGYLRAGAQVCGMPAWDPDFNTADFFMLLAMNQVDQRYARHFFCARCPATSYTGIPQLLTDWRAASGGILSSPIDDSQ